MSGAGNDIDGETPRSATVTALTPDDRRAHLRMLEALLFASREPLSEAMLADRLPDDVNVRLCLAELQSAYAGRGVVLARRGDGWAFRTADDLAWLMSREMEEPKKLSRPALETLAIIAYHQPVTRADIEEIRGVSVSRGTLDVLMDAGWVRIRGRRRSPGRPVTYGTTPGFLDHFALTAIDDLPGMEELKGAGLFDGPVPGGLSVPVPSDDPALRADEDPYEGDAEETREEETGASDEADADGEGEPR